MRKSSEKGRGTSSFSPFLRKGSVMLKITRSELLNEDMIECVSEYGNSPLRTIAGKARKSGNFREFRNRYGVKTIIIMDDGFVVLAPLRMDTYAERMEKEKFLMADPNRYVIRKSLIREIATKPNAQQRRAIKEAKENGKFVNLIGGKPAKYYVFTTTGRVYALRYLKESV